MGTSVLQMSSIINFILLARLLEPLDFGNLRQLILLNQIVFTIVFAATPTSLLYFCGKASKLEEKHSIALKHLVTLALSLTLVTVLIYFSTDLISAVFNNDNIKNYLTIFSFYPLFYTLYNCVPTFLVAIEKTCHLRWYCPLIAIINSLPLLLSAMYLPFIWVVYTFISCALISSSIGLSLILRLVGKRKKVELKYKHIIGFSWFLILAATITIIGTKVDQLIISNKLGTNIFAIYAVGAFQIPIFSLIQSSVNSVTLPKFTSLISEKKWHEYKNLWAESIDKIGRVSLPLAALVIIFSHEFITLLFGVEYSQSVPVFLLFSLIAPLKCISLGLYFRASGLPKYDVIGAVVFFIFSVVFSLYGSQYGMIGVATGMILSLVVFMIFMLTMIYSHSSGNIRFSDVIPPSFILKYIMWLVVFYLIRTMLSYFY